MIQNKITNFFSLKHMTGLRFLLFLEILILLLGVLLAQGLDMQFTAATFWSLPAFCLSFTIWFISSLLDYRKYFNLPTLIITGLITYYIFLLLFKFC